MRRLAYTPAGGCRKGYGAGRRRRAAGLALAVALGSLHSVGAAAAPQDVRTVELRYASTVAPIPDLYAHCAVPPAVRRAPLVLLVYGFLEDADAAPGQIERLAEAGLVACTLGLRGRNGAAGLPDAAGGEADDVADALPAIRAAFPLAVSAERAAVVGYSGAELTLGRRCRGAPCPRGRRLLYCG